MEESDQQYRDAFDHADGGMALLAADGTWRAANPALGRLLDRPLDTLVGTRARLAAGRDSPVLTAAATAELLDAYDLIAQTRLDHQARLIRRGRAPNDLVVPAAMSDFERSHLRDAFVVVTAAQSGALSALQAGAPGGGAVAP